MLLHRPPRQVPASPFFGNNSVIFLRLCASFTPESEMPLEWLPIFYKVRSGLLWLWVSTCSNLASGSLSTHHPPTQDLWARLMVSPALPALSRGISFSAPDIVCFSRMECPSIFLLQAFHSFKVQVKFHLFYAISSDLSCLLAPLVSLVGLTFFSNIGFRYVC